ncbi:cytosine deaminase [Microbacterium sp. SLBN-154]|uniref:amidohydrolase family protein n=1 Tax=Microbacterium sp. SLBN-154 TaxID=2768458 RepID=UPI001171AC8D|nr:amidohydrolase family protein [Microbacterium sp. SLBN-154]TQK17640.1 cytosine deaminase [Microbacterium sp. SLBN-154]
MDDSAATFLTNATMADGAVCDVEICNGVIAAVRPNDGRSSSAGPTSIDLSGYLLLPAAAEPHAHLDKALTWDLVGAPPGDLDSAIESYLDFERAVTEEEIYARARAAALKLLAAGVTAVRSHVNLMPGPLPYRGVDAMVRLRADLSEVMDVELVALPYIAAETDVIEGALDRGLDLVGGAPHLDSDPIYETNRILDIAERRGIGVDLHVDESLHGPTTMREFAAVVSGWPEDRSRTAGHCVRLGTLPRNEATAIAQMLSSSKIGVVTLPITNLYLQGREAEHSVPRGLTALRTLLDAGVVLSAGADNLRDPFNPMGRGDPLETASLLVTAGHLPVETAWGLVSAGARQVIGLPAAGPVVGLAADLLAVRGQSLAEVVAEASQDRMVFRAGKLVARTTLHRTMAVVS